MAVSLGRLQVFKASEAFAASRGFASTVERVELYDSVFRTCRAVCGPEDGSWHGWRGVEDGLIERRWIGEVD